MVTIFSIVYIIALVLLIKRKDYQPLKSRSVTLIFASTLGNFLFFSSLMYSKILQNNQWGIWNDIESEVKKDYGTGLKAAIEISCFFSNAQSWFFRPIWFIPYFFRSYRLHQIWGMQKIYYGDEFTDDVVEESGEDLSLSYRRAQSLNKSQQDKKESDAKKEKTRRKRVKAPSTYFI